MAKVSDGEMAGVAVAINFGCFLVLFFIFKMFEQPKRLCFRKSNVKAEDLEKTVGKTKRYTKQQKKKAAKKAEEQRLLGNDEASSGMRESLEKGDEGKTVVVEATAVSSEMGESTEVTPIVVAGTTEASS